MKEFFNIDEVYDRYTHTCHALYKTAIDEESFTQVLHQCIDKLETEANLRAENKQLYSPYGICKNINGVMLNIDVLKGSIFINSISWVR